jgi:DNA-binding transcriptional LysR family regulator
MQPELGRPPDFPLLAREGTLTTAAKALGVSHPTVARAGPGAGEPDRRPAVRPPARPLRADRAGEELLADTEAMEKAALSINRRSAGLGDTVSGVVRLSAGEAMAALLARHLPSCAEPDADRVRADRQPHARQPVAPRGRSS